jgi:hypothetical protein
VLEAVLERFMTASHDLADQDLAAIYELGGPTNSAPLRVRNLRGIQ